jgi:hypothetical protein
MFSKSLEASVARGYTPCSQNRDAHFVSTLCLSLEFLTQVLFWTLSYVNALDFCTSTQIA